MGQNQLTLSAEPGTSLSSGSLRLYAMVAPPADATLPTHDAHPVGAIDLYAYDPLNRRAAVGIAVATDHRRRGYALAMLRQLADLAGNTLHLHQLYADIADANTASLALFAKAGFTPCGHFDQWLLVGDRFIDTTRMQLILE